MQLPAVVSNVVVVGDGDDADGDDDDDGAEWRS
jgi:hypothetical protein